MTTNPPADAARLRELLEKATPGPWTFVPGVKVSYFHRNIHAHGKPLAHVLSTKNIGAAGDADSNAAIIVEAVNSLPSLLDLLAAQASQIEALEKSLRTVQSAAKTIASAHGTELEHLRQNATYDHRLRGEHESLLDRDALMTEALEAAESRATAAEAKAAKMREALKELQDHHWALLKNQRDATEQAAIHAKHDLKEAVKKGWNSHLPTIAEVQAAFNDAALDQEARP